MSEKLDIRVALTTSSSVIITEKGDSDLEIDMFLMNVPICVAEISLNIKDVREDAKKRMIAGVSGMLQQIRIDPWGRTVFIGQDPDLPETSLVEYTEENDDAEPANNFFKRWEETSTLFFECQFLNNSNKVIFCVIGLWVVDQWKRITTRDEPMITVKSDL